MMRGGPPLVDAAEAKPEVASVKEETTGEVPGLGFGEFRPEEDPA